MKEGEQQEWQAACSGADTTGVLISPAPQQRKCTHLRFTVPLFFCRSQRREKERGRDEKRKQNKTTKKSHVWVRWQAGSRRKCWIGRAVRCVWEWEGWGLPTQRPAAQQHWNPAETGQGEADVPLTQRVKAGRRGGGIRSGRPAGWWDVFVFLLKWVRELRMASWDRHEKLLSSGSAWERESDLMGQKKKTGRGKGAVERRGKIKLKGWGWFCHWIAKIIVRYNVLIVLLLPRLRFDVFERVFMKSQEWRKMCGDSLYIV